MNQKRDGKSWLLWILPILFLSFFFFYPLVSIFSLALGKPSDIRGLNPDAILRPLGFTVWQASLSTLITVLVGLPAAYIFARYKFPAKSLLRVLTTLPFILPTVVVAAAFNALIGPRGWVNLALMDWFNLSSPPVQMLNSLPAILLAHVFYNTSVIIRVVGSAWSQLNPRYEQAARILGADNWKVFWQVTFPLLKPAILAALLLVFLFDFTSFGVVLMLGGPKYATLEVEIYTQAMHMLNLPLASVLSMVQLLFTLVLTAGYSWFTNKATVTSAPRVDDDEVLSLSNRPERGAVIAFLTLLLGFLVLPLLALAARSFFRLDADNNLIFTLDYYKELFINRRGSLMYIPPIQAARNSLFYASLTVILSLGLGFLPPRSLPIFSWVNRVMDPILMLPMGPSAVTLGLGFIVVFTRPPFQLQDSPWLIPAAHTLVALPFVVRTLTPALSSIPGSLRQAAAVLGASPFRVWLEVDLPIIMRAAIVSAVFAFAMSLGEFGATSFLARPEYPTLPIAIYRFIGQPGAMNYGQALAMSTILFTLCAVGIMIIEQLRPPGAKQEL
ncbi:MAG TPA: iron ABC transporter permease [Bellilinea sp.]|nr:iron ABC transporter permease [Bellilinea sp.]